MTNEHVDLDAIIAATENERLIQETLDHKPSPHPKLLMWSGDDERDAFITPGFLTTQGYVDSYYEAAMELSRQAPHDVAIDSAAIAILYLYRHFVELALKSCIIALGAHIHANDPSFRFNEPDEHDLSRLLNRVRTLHGQTLQYLDGLALPSRQAQNFVEELATVDPAGIAFRYVTELANDKLPGPRQRTITRQFEVNLDVLDAGMLHVYKELTWYRDLIVISTDLFEQYLSDSAP